MWLFNISHEKRRSENEFSDLPAHTLYKVVYCLQFIYVASQIDSIPRIHHQLFHLFFVYIDQLFHVHK